MDPSPLEGAPTAWRGWGLVAYLCALVLAGSIGYFLVQVPFQVGDNVWNLITVDQRSLLQLLTDNGLRRPLLWGTLKLAAEASGGYYFEVFRGIQALQVALLFVLIVRVLGVRTARDAAVVPLTLLVLAGFHTFRNLVQEAYPINTYLSALVYVAAAMNLAIARPGWRTDAAAVAILVVATLTIETGLLVWVVLVVAYLTGFRGVSRGALGLGTVLVTAYVAMMFVQLSGTGGMLTNAPTGFGLSRLEPQEVAERFGRNPLPFWAYNVASSIATVLAAEPRRGTWYFVAAWMNDDLRVSQWLAVGVTSTTSFLMMAFATARCRDWCRHAIPPRERWLVVFVGVLVANAAMSFAYTKDDIMSPAGMLYAVAAYGVVSTLLAVVSAHPPRVTVFAVPLFLLACGWSIRVMDLPYALVLSALKNQTDWARIEQWKEQNSFYERAPGYSPFVDRLEEEALGMHVPNPFLSRRMRLWDREYSGARQ